MSDYTFFSKDSGCWGKSYQSLWGTPQHLFALTVVQHCPSDPVRANLPYPPEGMGWCRKFCSNIPFLLVLPKEGVARERMYGLAIVWVHPYQARISTIDSTAKQLAQLASTGPNWPYALVLHNGDTCHVPLPIEGHLSVMVEGSTSSVPYGMICQLEVCQLLSSDFLVVYPEGLSGCHVPVIQLYPSPCPMVWPCSKANQLSYK